MLTYKALSISFKSLRSLAILLIFLSKCGFTSSDISFWLDIIFYLISNNFLYFAYFSFFSLYYLYSSSILAIYSNNRNSSSCIWIYWAFCSWLFYRHSCILAYNYSLFFISSSALSANAILFFFLFFSASILFSIS